MEYISLFTVVLAAEGAAGMTAFMWLCIGLAIVGVLGAALAVISSEQSLEK
jgi:hypothetical protein